MVQQRMTISRFLPILLVCLTACDSPTDNGGVICPAWIQRAIEVDVTDASTGLPIARDAKGIVRDGTFADSLRVVGWRGLPPNDTATTLGAALGRRGTYDVYIERAGYQPWAQMGVTPHVGACGLETKHLQAALARQP